MVIERRRLRNIKENVFATPPILTQPLEATSITLVQEFGREQRPIYFISNVLQGVETRYQKIEKAVLAVIVTTRKLWPYF
ncbi:hypothetical protein CR513_24157, partial [Mucuna pruriens]